MTLHGTRDVDLCKLLSQYKLPNLRVIGLLSVINHRELSIEFINSLPNSVEGFFISGDTFPPRPDLSPFLEAIVKNSKAIKSELWVNRNLIIRRFDYLLLPKKILNESSIRSLN